MSNYKNSYKCNQNFMLPNVIDQTNKVNGGKLTHVWANADGYGNIKLSNGEKKTVHPWNRITPLSMPTSTPVDVKNSWDV